MGEIITGKCNKIDFNSVGAENSGEMTTSAFPEVLAQWTPPKATVYIHDHEIGSGHLNRPGDNFTIESTRIETNPVKPFGEKSPYVTYTISLARRHGSI